MAQPLVVCLMLLAARGGGDGRATSRGFVCILMLIIIFRSAKQQQQHDTAEARRRMLSFTSWRIARAYPCKHEVVVVVECRSVRSAILTAVRQATECGCTTNAMSISAQGYDDLKNNDAIFIHFVVFLSPTTNSICACMRKSHINLTNFRYQWLRGFQCIHPHRNCAVQVR